MKSVYEAYVPSYAVSYDALGDQETMTLKYSWELAVYFSFYVFPFINDLFTRRSFVPSFLQRFSRLGPMNRGMQEFLMGYYGWKKEHPLPGPTGPLYFDFYEIWALKSAETCFYKVGVTPEEARRVLDEQLAHLEELARWVYAYVAATVTGDERALTHPDFVGAIDTEELVFAPAQMAERLAACGETDERWAWGFAPPSLQRFRGEGAMEEPEMETPEAMDEEAPAALIGEVGGAR